MSTLDDWIRKELTVNIEEELSKYKKKVKDLLSLTPSGEVLIKRNDLKAKEKILAYLIAKVYAKVANYSEGTATNKELVEALHLPEGTVKFCLHALRQEGLVLSETGGVHQIKIANIGKAFESYFGGEKQS